MVTLIKSTLAFLLILWGIAEIPFTQSVVREYTGFIRKPIIVSEKQLNCLAENVYREARGETKEGMNLVAMTTLNRARKAKATICSTVYKPHQFSWTSLKHKSKISKKEFLEIKGLVKNVVNTQYEYQNQRVLKITHFYNPHKVKKPKWANEMKVFKQEGNHIFLAEK